MSKFYSISTEADKNNEKYFKIETANKKILSSGRTIAFLKEAERLLRKEDVKIDKYIASNLKKAINETILPRCQEKKFFNIASFIPGTKAFTIRRKASYILKLAEKKSTALETKRAAIKKKETEERVAQEKELREMSLANKTDPTKFFYLNMTTSRFNFNNSYTDKMNRRYFLICIPTSGKMDPQGGNLTALWFHADRDTKTRVAIEFKDQGEDVFARVLSIDEMRKLKKDCESQGHDWKITTIFANEIEQQKVLENPETYMNVLNRCLNL